MAWKSFDEVLASNKYDKSSLQKLCFRIGNDFTCPQCQVNFGEKYSDPKQAVENDDYTIEITSPITQQINDTQVKKNILAKLFYHHTEFNPSSANHSQS